MFAVAKFESNNDADTVCKELFTKRALPKKKERVKQGKVAKKVAKKSVLENEGKIKDEIRNFLSKNFVANGVDKVKLKKKKKKSKHKGEETQNIEHVTTNETPKKKRKKKKKKKQDTPPDFIAIDETITEERNTKKKKKKKKQDAPSDETITEERNTKKKKQNETKTVQETPLDYNEKKQEKLKRKLQQTLASQPSLPKKTPSKNLTLRQRMMEKLQAARFRYLNEQIYSSDSKEAQKIFKQDPDAFSAYHDGYRQQVGKWPLNPVDVIIKTIQKMPQNHIIADFGCGEAKIAQSVPQKVHSFDLVAINDLVVPCDMAHVPLGNLSVDVVVFCLSLMGTNLHDYLLEANRVLKPGGILKVAEVESRFEDLNQFLEALKRFNFKNTWKDLSHNLFYFLDFKKEANIKNKKKLPTVSLHPCLYKKR